MKNSPLLTKGMADLFLENYAKDFMDSIKLSKDQFGRWVVDSSLGQIITIHHVCADFTEGIYNENNERLVFFPKAEYEPTFRFWKNGMRCSRCQEKMPRNTLESIESFVKFNSIRKGA